MNKLKSKFNEMKNGINKKLGLNLLGILAVFAIMIGVTYAGLRFDRASDQNSITSGKISMSYKESSNVINMDGVYPIPDSEGMTQSDYFEFSITSNAGTNVGSEDKVYIPYSLIIQLKDVASGKTLLPADQLKVYLTKVEGSEELPVVSPTLLSNINKIDDSNYKLYSKRNIHQNGEGKITTKYRLRTWVDDAVNPLDWGENAYQIKFALNVNGSANTEFKNLDKSGANEPLLVDNMIPVYYDSVSKAWKVADETNVDTENQWYDYDKKQYANVVTLNKSKYFKSAENNVLDTGSWGFTHLKETILTYEEKKDGYIYTYFDNTAKCSTSYTFDDKTGKFSLVNPVDTDITNLSAPRYCVNYYDSDVGSSDSIDYITSSCSASYVPGFDGVYEYYCSGNGYTARGKTFIEKYGSTAYTYDKATATYKLTDPVKIPYTPASKDYYTCDSETETECKRMYKIKTVSEDSYGTVSSSNIFESSITISNYESNLTPGMTIPDEDIDTMWVWIPRFKYTYFKSTTPVEIPITFEKGTESTGTIKCTDAISTTSNKSETCSDTTNGGLKVGVSTYTHPAFTFGNDKLTGLWIAKYKPSINKTQMKSGLSEYSTSLSKQFKLVREMEGPNNIYGFPQSGTELNAVTGEITGDSNNFDIHPIKSMEYGAMLYLSHSKYGNCVDGTCSKVASPNNGNPYGIYSLPAVTMGNMVNKSLKFNVDSAGTWSDVNTPLAKYYDKYSYGTSYNNSTAFGRSKLGDGISEVYISGSNLWYNTSNYMPYGSTSGSSTYYYPWLERTGFVSGYDSGSSTYTHPVITIIE